MADKSTSISAQKEPFNIYPTINSSGSHNEFPNSYNIPSFILERNSLLLIKIKQQIVEFNSRTHGWDSCKLRQRANEVGGL